MAASAGMAMAGEDLAWDGETMVMQGLYCTTHEQTMPDPCNHSPVIPGRCSRGYTCE